MLLPRCALIYTFADKQKKMWVTIDAVLAKSDDEEAKDDMIFVAE